LEKLKRSSKKPNPAIDFVIDLVSRRLYFERAGEEKWKPLCDGTYQGDQNQIQFLMEYQKAQKYSSQYNGSEELMGLLRSMNDTLRAPSPTNTFETKVSLSIETIAHAMVGTDYSLNKVSEKTVERLKHCFVI